MAECLVGLAGVMGAGGQAERAAQLVGAAERLLEVAGTAISAANQRDYVRTLGAIRRLIGEAAFTAARTAGHTLGWEQVVTQALDGPIQGTSAKYNDR